MGNAPVVGVDIGTFAVRAAEIVLKGDTPVLSAFAQVTLPPGAVVDGEVVEVAAVAAALKRLWSEGRFRTTKVVVGVSSQRVIVRQVEMAAMGDEELRSALRFEAQELLPIPLEDALLDCCVLERGTGTEESPTMRVLLAAAQREVVHTHLAAVQAAGLTVTSVDVQPLALLRALPDGPTGEDGAPGAPVGSEALIAVGGGLTTVVVREHGVPRFMRVLNVGGADVTDAIAEELGCDLDYAEDLKRRATSASATAVGGGATATTIKAAQMVAQHVSPLVEEIRGSLDFYLAQSDVDHIDRILLTGGGLRTPGLVTRLHDALGQPVEIVDPRLQVEIGKTGLTPEQLERAIPLMVAPIGLALAERPATPGHVPMRINLLPEEVTIARQHKRQAVLAGAGVGVLALALSAGWGVRAAQVHHRVAAAEDAEASVSTLQSQIAKLHDVSQVESDLKSRQVQAKAALAGDVDWVRLIQQVTASMPDDVWLTAFSAQPGQGKEPGTVVVAAAGLSEQSVVRWVQQVGSLPSLNGLWVPSESKATGDNNVVTVTFQSTANITAAAGSDRAAHIGGAK